MELQLFVIWNNAQAFADTIIQDISQQFEIVHIENILWDVDAFAENISRFYGQKLPDRSSKIEECGVGRFTLVVVADHQPAYEVRKTSKGEALVNINMFDLKSRFRQMTGGGHKIHGTNSVEETRHDVLLLTHQSYETFCRRSTGQHQTSIPTAINSDKNLLGYRQWNSLQEMFNTLNETLPYVVMRNFEGMPTHFFSGDHEDIDILVANPAEARFILNAKKLSRLSYRSNYLVHIGNRAIRFDIRFSGDGYYDATWQNVILQNRVLQHGIYIPDPENFRFMLLYHALIHKRNVADDYSQKLSKLGFEQVDQRQNTIIHFCKIKQYRFTVPVDLSVFYNARLLGSSASPKRALYEVLRRTYKQSSAVILHTKKILKNAIRKKMYR